jgi:outer membrane protein assembly factor BamB
MKARRVVVGAAAVAAVLAVGGVAAYLLVVRAQAQDVTGSSTEEFVTTQAPEPKPPRVPGIEWPTYGFANTRDRVSPYAHRPPFRRLWLFRGRTLLELPPAVAYGRLYVSNNAGFTYAVDVETGRMRWRHAAGRCVASSPAVAGGLVFQAFLNRPPCNSQASPDEIDGRVIAFDARTGAVRWSASLGPTESSPLVVGDLVVVGDWRGDVVAFDRHTGARRWSYRTDGRVKGAMAQSGDLVFAGAYDGRLYALDRRSGRLRWRSASQDRLGGRGAFYSTPAVAYGRVYIGSTDGKVYAFGAATGNLLWSRSTGGYVYSSPAVWRRTVYAGSYDGKLYAFDAATGEVRWASEMGGPVSGSPTVMAGVVYAATLEEQTLGLDATTGREVWRFPDGKYTPIVADRERVYLVGHARVYGLTPR